MARTQPRDLSAHWRGHLFRFGTKSSSTYDGSAGFRLLLIVLLLEGVIGPRLLLATSFLWGFYQEVVYRGILQTELVRRMGSVGGILVGNFLFTFGPLHFYHFSSTSSALPMFAGIFAIGLFFAVLFQRSGNLWMVAIFHGLGDSYISGTLSQ
jgi:membrane protease YdiL (CAAX protease family)